jgi:hypothetical protein
VLQRVTVLDLTVLNQYDDPGKRFMKKYGNLIMCLKILTPLLNEILLQQT